MAHKINTARKDSQKHSTRRKAQKRGLTGPPPSRAEIPRARDNEKDFRRQDSRRKAGKSGRPSGRGISGGNIYVRHGKKLRQS